MIVHDHLWLLMIIDGIIYVIVYVIIYVTIYERGISSWFHFECITHVAVCSTRKKTVATVQQIADFLISIHFGGEIKYHFPIEPQPWPSPKPSSNITITIHQPFTMVIDPWSMSSWDCHKIQPRIGWFIKSKRWLHCWARSFFRNIQGGAPPVINCL